MNSRRLAPGRTEDSVEETAFAAIVETLAADPRVTQSRMFGSPGLKTGRKVFAMLVKGRLVVKVSARRAGEIVASGVGAYFDPGHGRLMKEWVEIAGGSHEDWMSLVKEATANALSASLAPVRKL